MESSKQERVLNYIADSIESGYSAVFTFAVKELLNANERTEIAKTIRNLAISPQHYLAENSTESSRPVVN